MSPSRKNLPVARVYIDGANMFYAQKKLGWFIDWKKLKTQLRKKFKIKKINFYIGEKEGDKSQEGFREKLKSFGFRIRTKPLKRVNIAEPGEKSVYQFKANFDVEMAIEAIWESYFDKTCKTIIIFGGDSDFAFLVKFLKNKLKRKVIIYSGKKMLSWELKLLGDRVVFLDDLKEEFFLKNWSLTNIKKSVKK